MKSQTRQISSVEPSSPTQNENTVSSANSNDFNRKQAIELYKRLAGTTPHIESQTIEQMRTYLDQRDPFSAAYLATSESGFYNITVRDFAVKLSNIDLSVKAPLNDLAATVVGSVRDDISAINLLTENYYYYAPNINDVASDIEDDLVRSNNHYIELEEKGYDLDEVLVKADNQQVVSPSGQLTTLSDSAGILTSRAFMSAHAEAGTNRRIIEYSFKVFLCTPINEWANSSNPDNRVGPDVGRFPQSDYLNKCKACHSGMDALRPATAHFDFSDGFIKYNYTYNNDPNPDDPSQINVRVPASEQNIPYKFRRSSDNFPGGFRVSNNRWVNYADNNQFGFRTAQSGSGMKDLGQMIAYSEQYSRCLVKRVFESVCRRKVDNNDLDLIDELTTKFENDNHNLRNLFAEIAIQPQCIGLEL